MKTVLVVLICGLQSALARTDFSYGPHLHVDFVHPDGPWAKYHLNMFPVYNVMENQMVVPLPTHIHCDSNTEIDITPEDSFETTTKFIPAEAPVRPERFVARRVHRKRRPRGPLTAARLLTGSPSEVTTAASFALEEEDTSPDSEITESPETTETPATTVASEEDSTSEDPLEIGVIFIKKKPGKDSSLGEGSPSDIDTIDSEGQTESPEMAALLNKMKTILRIKKKRNGL